MLWTEIRKLQSKSWETRRDAARVLGNSKSRRAVKALAEALKDRSVQVREAALESLAQISTPETVEPLIGLLVDEKLWVREDAARALERALPAWPKSAAAKKILPRLVDALKSENSDIQAAAQTTLGQIGDLTSLEPLLASMKKKGDLVVIQAVGKIGNHEAVPPLIAMLTEPRPWIHKEVMLALDRIDTLWTLGATAQRAVPHLICALSAENFLVRVSAARTLGRIKDRVAFEPLLAALADGGYVAQAAEEALAKIDPDWQRTEMAQRTAGLFVPGLKDSDGDVRLSSASVLGRLGDSQCLHQLVEALVDEQARVRNAALKSLETIDRGWAGTQAARDAVPALIDALRHRSADVQHAAAETLARICDDRALEPLLDSLRDHHLAAAAQAVGNLKDKRAVEPLVNSLLDKSLFVRLSIERALCDIDPDWSRSKAARAAVPGFMKAFKENSDREVRRAAAEALGRIGDTRAISLLSMGHRDEDTDVAKAAADALKRIRISGSA